MTIFIIIIAVIIALFFILKFTAKVDFKNILFISGEPGSGKTLYGVKIAKKVIKRNIKYTKAKNRHSKLYNILIAKPFKKSYKVLRDRPVIYSNIPLYFKNINVVRLTKDMLMLKERLINNSVVFIDEFGTVANQYDFSEEDVRINISEFTRLFRHYVGDKSCLIMLDQSIERVIKEVRLCIGKYFQFSRFKKIWRIGFNRVITYQNSAQENAIINKEDIKTKFYWLPFKKVYDSEVFSVRVDNYLALAELKNYPDDDLKYDELIRLANNYSNLDKKIIKVKKEASKQKEATKKINNN